jgi:hypothetical protein
MLPVGCDSPFFDGSNRNESVLFSRKDKCGTLGARGVFDGPIKGDQSEGAKRTSKVCPSE